MLAAVRRQSQAVNISTVYRTLELLEELGLVRHAHLSDRAPTYHSTTEPEHVHLVCRDCGGHRGRPGGADAAVADRSRPSTASPSTWAT